MLARIKNHRETVSPPVQITLTAKLVWKFRGKAIEFLYTNCELTTFAIRDMLTPGRADTAWKCVQHLPEPRPHAFEVLFGEVGEEGHFLFVIGNSVYQSFAFKHEVEESPYDSGKPFYAHISEKPHRFSDGPVSFCICPDLS